MPQQLDALVVSDRMEHLKALVRILDGLQTNVYVACSFKQAHEVLGRQPLAMVFCDERVSGSSYRDLLQSMGIKRRGSRFVIMLHTGEWDEYLEAMRLGAFEVIRCPVQPTDVEMTLIHATRDEAQRAAMRMTA
jgi:DNA-binding NtrC family response regulator